ncbi:hypothetical protein ACFL1B_04895 [Nanoarchaeota archaeon]
MSLDIKVIGDGFRGEKAEQFIRKTPRLRKIGWETTPKWILTEDVLDQYLKASFLGDGVRTMNVWQDTDELRKDIIGHAHRMPHNMDGALEGICQETQPNSLMVRSSAANDARGTGIYKSLRAEADIDQVKRTVAELLASYYGRDGIAFRMNTGSEGFAIIIEPLITFQPGKEPSCPVFSGMGYTSTKSGEGYVFMDIGEAGGIKNEVSYTARRLNLGDRKGIGEFIQKAKEHWNLDDLDAQTDYFLNMIAETEKEFGSQYFEFATAPTRKAPRVLSYWITQIADFDKTTELVDLTSAKNVIINGTTVVGAGDFICDKAVLCMNKNDAFRMHLFNLQNKGYAIFFASELNTSGMRGLKYYDVRNAQCIMELPTHEHRVGTSLEHFGGALDASQKMFGTVHFHFQEELDKLFPETEGQLRVYDEPLRVIANLQPPSFVIDKL